MFQDGPGPTPESPGRVKRHLCDLDTDQNATQTAGQRLGRAIDGLVDAGCQDHTSRAVAIGLLPDYHDEEGLPDEVN